MSIKKRIAIISLTALVGVFVVTGLAIHLGTPTIKASNIETYHNQIASNAPIEIAFSQLMDRASVESSFKTFPQMGGRFSWNLNTMTFYPEERFAIGQMYTITISADAKNILDKPLGKDVVLTFLVVDPPTISLAVPKGETDVDSKITVMFNRPMVALTTYDEYEKGVFPLEIKPQIVGRFKWIGTSALQFIPTDRLAYSTKYEITVPAGTQSLDGGKFDNPFTFDFSTPKIALMNSAEVPQKNSTISGSSPYILAFNQDVNLDSLKEHLKITNKDGKEVALKAKYNKRKETVVDKDGKRTEKEVEDKKIAEIMPEKDDWGYDNEFKVNMTKGVAGVEGNLVSESEIKDSKFATLAFLTGHFPNNETGVNPSGDIVLNFDQEVDLASVESAFSLQPSAQLKISYGRMCDPKWEPEKSPDEKCDEIDNLASAVFTPKEKLNNLQKYSAKLNKSVKTKNGIAYLKNDVLFDFTVADVFKIIGNNLSSDGSGSYRRLCLYTNNLADTKDLEKSVSFSPAGKWKVAVEAHELFDQSTPKYPQYHEPDEILPCEKQNPSQKYVLEVWAYLSPSVKHVLTIKNDAKDAFGQKLGKDFVLNFKTIAMNDADMSLDIMQPNSYAVATLDQHALPVISTNNLTDFDLEFCRISAEKFVEINTAYDRDANPNKRYTDFGFRAFTPSQDNCLEYKKIAKKLKNSYWEKQYTEVDLASELGASPQPGYYFIKASSPHIYRLDPIYVYDAKLGYSAITGTKKVDISPWQVLNLTNLHLTVKSSRDSVTFWATDLKTGKPMKDVSIKLYSNIGAKLDGVSVTDKNGIAKRELHELPFDYALAVAPESAGRDSIAVSRDWGEGINAWEFNYNYSQLYKYTQGYIYTDRPLYKPTHQVFFKGFIRNDDDAKLSLPQAGSEVDVEINDVRGTSVYKKKLPVSSVGTYSDSFNLAKEASLGMYTISACPKKSEKGYCATNEASQVFYVEEYRKPEYKMDIKFSKAEFNDKDVLSADILGQYFFGAPLSKAKLTWGIRAQNYYFDEYKGEWYSFNDYDTFKQCYFGCPYVDREIAAGDGTLDVAGKFSVSQKVDLSTKDADGKVKAPDSSKIYTLYTTAQDKNNQTVAASKEVIVHRGEYYVGVKNDKYVVSKGEKMPIRVITVDHKGNPVGGKSIKLELNKIDWKYVKKRNVDGAFYWDSQQDIKVVDTSSVSTDGDGKAAGGFTVSEGGEYFVRATGRDGVGNSISSTVDYYVSTGEAVNWKKENNNRMELKADKTSYSVGDTAKVLVKSPYANVNALVTYERGDVFESKVVNIASNAHVIEVPITAKMVPNFYVSVLEVKGGDKTDPPDFKMGYVNVTVDTKAKELVISVATDKERYGPREKVNIEITTTNRDGKPISADVSIAAVDESLLALKGNPKRDLVNVFYGKRDLGVLTADNMTNFLERINVSELKGAKGGSGKGGNEFAEPRGDFKDTAFWKDSLITNASGKVSTSFVLPDNLTTWNLEVIGATKDSLFGSVNKTVTTQKAVTLRPVLPRFALKGDKLSLGAIVHNFTGKKDNFEVGIEVKNLKLDGSANKNVTIAADGSEKVMFDVTVAQVAKGELAEVILSADGGGQGDSVIQKFPIYPYSTPETVALSSFTDDVSYTEKIALPKVIDPEQGELSITTGATLATYISNSLNYLIHFPYGCTEQTISSLLPMIVINNATSFPQLKEKFKIDLKDENDKPTDLGTVVQKSLQKLYQYQRPEGGWGYFPESTESYVSLTAYTVFGLDQIKKAGFHVDAGAINRAVAYLKDYMANNRDLIDRYTGKLHKKDAEYANNRAYLLFVLSEIGSGDVGLTNSLYEDNKLLGNAGKAYMIMTLNSLSPSSTDKIKVLVGDLENQARIDARGSYIRNDISGGMSMMTHTKVTALTVQALTRVDVGHPLLPKLIKWLIGVRKDGRWDTTQDNVTSLIALTEYLAKTKELTADYKAKIAFDGKVAKEYSINSSNILDQQTITKAINELTLGGDGNSLIFSKNGTGRIYYDIVLKYFLPIEEIASRSEGFNIERNYYRLDDKKMENPVTKAKIGETLRGHISIVVPEERSLVALENFLPAGFELVNFEFGTSDKRLLESDDSNPISYEDGYYYGISTWTHKEMRDDRLFLFADRLPKGVYEYDFYVNVTSEGEFHQPPAVISEMYFPENFGRTKGTWMKVE